MEHPLKMGLSFPWEFQGFSPGPSQVPPGSQLFTETFISGGQSDEKATLSR